MPDGRSASAGEDEERDRFGRREDDREQGGECLPGQARIFNTRESLRCFFIASWFNFILKYFSIRCRLARCLGYRSLID